MLLAKIKITELIFLGGTNHWQSNILEKKKKIKALIFFLSGLCVCVCIENGCRNYSIFSEIKIKLFVMPQRYEYDIHLGLGV